MTIIEQGHKSKFRRFMDRVVEWEDTMNYSSGDYALERIAALEKQIAELRDELRHSFPRS